VEYSQRHGIRSYCNISTSSDEMLFFRYTDAFIRGSEGGHHNKSVDGICSVNDDDSKGEQSGHNASHTKSSKRTEQDGSFPSQLTKLYNHLGHYSLIASPSVWRVIMGWIDENIQEEQRDRVTDKESIG